MATIGKILTSAGLPSGTNTGAAAQIRKLENDDINSMSFEELRKVGDRVRKVVNDNYRRTLRVFPEGTFATDILEEGGGPISMRGITNIDKLRSEVMRGIRFMRSQTSTVSGEKKYNITMENVISGYSMLNKEQKKEFWKGIDDLRKKIKENKKSYDSREIIDTAWEIYKKGIEIPESASITKDHTKAEQILWKMFFDRAIAVMNMEEAIKRANEDFEKAATWKKGIRV